MDPERRGGYSPCRACGDTDVLVNVASFDELREWVWTACATCENRRGGWYRKRKDLTPVDPSAKVVPNNTNTKGTP